MEAEVFRMAAEKKYKFHPPKIIFPHFIAILNRFRLSLLFKYQFQFNNIFLSFFHKQF